MLKDLLTQRLLPYRKLLIVVVVFQAIQAVAGLVLPTINADIIDRGVARGDIGIIWRLGGWMVVVTLVQVAFAIGAVHAGSKVATGFGRDARAVMFARVNSFSAREVNTFGAPSLITRITNDVQQVQMLVLTTCTLLVAAPFTAIGGLILAVQQDAALSWVIVVAVPIVAVLLGTVISKMVPTFRKMQEFIDRINEILREQLTGVRVVRAFGREDDQMEKFRAGNALLTATALRGGRLMGLMFPTATLIVNLSSVAVVWLAGGRIADGRMDVGSLVAYLTYLTQILMAVLMATFMAALLPRASVSAERIQEIMSTESSIRHSVDPVSEIDGPIRLELRRVGFRYPGADEPVLADVSVTVNAGETLAIIGSTGSGKTTLVNIMARLIDPTEGAVLINGVDLTRLAPEVLGSLYGYVPQRPYLFSGTIASNLRYGKDEATQADMWEALDISQATEFVRERGLDAPIAQGGANVSGGQRQRLSIARAVIRRPRIYIFDDAFSALDLATDARLRASLQPHLSDAVTVIIGQRVSTIRHADQIMVLEDGRVVGLGTHAELEESCATYQEILASQAMTAGVGQ
ncbi:MAG: ABC transporter ATP-binding protein [Actinomycetota bacterium]